MKIQKIILCAAALLAAFGASLGLFEIGNYLRTAFEPIIKVEIKPLEPFTPPVYAPERRAQFNPPTFTATAEAPAEESEDWGETGDYYIAGPPAQGFEDFDCLTILTSEFNEKLDKVIAIKPDGTIRISGREFDITWISITDKRISLVTQTKKGISYQFDGRFVDEMLKVKVEYAADYTANVLLKGRLTKWRSGVKIAEAKVNFETGGC